MSDNAPVPLSYDAAPPRRGDSLFGLIGLGLALLCAAVPLLMARQILAGTRHNFGVYTPYADTIGALHFGGNRPWFIVDTTALLLGIVGLQRGRPRFAVAAIAVAGLSMAGVMTIVLGSPW